MEGPTRDIPARAEPPESVGLFPIMQAEDLAAAIRARMRVPPREPQHSNAEYQHAMGTQIVFIPRSVVQPIAQAVIQAPNEAEQIHAQLVAVQDAVMQDEHRARQVRRVAEMAGNDLAQAIGHANVRRRVEAEDEPIDVQGMLREGMSADQILDVVNQRVRARNGRGVQMPLAIAPAPPVAPQPLGLRGNVRPADVIEAIPLTPTASRQIPRRAGRERSRSDSPPRNEGGSGSGLVPYSGRIREPKAKAAPKRRVLPASFNAPIPPREPEQPVRRRMTGKQPRPPAYQ